MPTLSPRNILIDDGNIYLAQVLALLQTTEQYRGEKRKCRGVLDKENDRSRGLQSWT
jgi:hypothetical protein